MNAPVPVTAAEYRAEAEAKAIADHDAGFDALIVRQFDVLAAQSQTWQGIDQAAVANLKRNIEMLQNADRRVHWLAELKRIGVS